MDPKRTKIEDKEEASYQMMMDTLDDPKNKKKKNELIINE